MLDLGPRARVVFAVAYLAAQASLVFTGPSRPDRAFAFQMFNESSTLRIALAREVDAPSGHGTVAVPIPNGAWSAKDTDGTLHHFAWRDRVHAPELCAFDRPVQASYGILAQLARLQAALDDVACHVPEDAETRRLVAEVTVRRNGREASVVRLTSGARAP